jgi:hypothetical protein
MIPSIAGTIDSGKAHSRKEVIAALNYGLPCPTCGATDVFKNELPAEGEWVFAARTECVECGHSWRRRFTAGSGWHDQPEYEDPRLTTASEPTALIAEQRFRDSLQSDLDSLRELGDEPEGPPDAVEEWRGAALMWARAGLEAVLELEKFAAARGETVDDQEAANKRWLAERFVGAGGVLPAGFQR